MKQPNMIPIERFKELVPSSNGIDNETLKTNRNKLYGLARRLIELFDQFTNYITRSRTIDAKARIVK